MKQDVKKVSHLKSHIGFWMRLVSNQVSSSFARKLEKSGVTVAEWVVLREMFDCGDTFPPSQIAELTGLSRGAVSKLTDRLLEKKMVTRKESETDRRYQELKLTKEAKVLIPKLGVLADENDDQFFSVLTKAERKTLTDLLMKTAELNQFNKMPIQ
ncbi:MarR family winged helix-turn-helix transcriptional regulator [Leptospira idonii]|nr:MarR family transcriptional regulator [Leptospira idonii]